MRPLGAWLGRPLHPAAVVIGAMGAAGCAAVHGWLYLSEGYRHIPTIGPLFVMTVVVSVVLIMVLGLVRNVGAGVVAAGFLISVLAGYALSATIGLFGFTETGETGAAWLAGIGEGGGALALVLGVGAAVVVSSGRNVGRKPSGSSTAEN